MCACTCILESTVLLTAREYQTLSKRRLSYAALKAESISLPLIVLLQSTKVQRLSGPPYGKPPYVLEGCQGIQKLAMR